MKTENPRKMVIRQSVSAVTIWYYGVGNQVETDKTKLSHESLLDEDL